jgi:rod shape-determining protein MreD
MNQRLAITMLLSFAVLGDAALGALQPAILRPPVLSLAVVAGVALVVGARIGMAAGFVAGVVLDLLSGPASLAGVHTLMALLIGVAVGLGRRHVRHVSSMLATVAGGVAVAGAAVLFVVLHRLLGSAVGDLRAAVVGQALAAGAIVAPIAQRTLLRLVVRPLLQKPQAS